MQKADVEKLQALLEPHLDALFGAAIRLTGSRPDAEDLVQETCVRACTHLERLTESDQPRSWLLRVQYNLFIDGARREQRSPVRSHAGGDSPEALASAHESNPEAFFYSSQVGERLHRAWLGLHRDHRALLALRAEGYRLSELTEITGLSKDVLNMRLYRARRHLARLLDEDFEAAPRIRLETAK